MKMKKHAILLSGGINRSANAPRYRKDLEFAYEVLVNDCGFDESNREKIILKKHFNTLLTLLIYSLKPHNK